jgi:hypothetical protein
LIDFAHFLGREQGGVPLLDLAKLTVDLSVWGTMDLAFADLLSGVALDSSILKDIVSLYLVNREGKASEDERRLFGCAAACFLALYSVYEDVPSNKRESIRAALMAIGG